MRRWPIVTTGCLVALVALCVYLASEDLPGVERLRPPTAARGEHPDRERFPRPLRDPGDPFAGDPILDPVVWNLSVRVDGVDPADLDAVRVVFVPAEQYYSIQPRTLETTTTFLIEAEGSGHLEVSAPGYVPVRVDGLSPPPAGERELLVRLDRGGILSGVVVGPEGEPLRAVVVAEPVEGPAFETLDPSPRVETDQDGAFRFEGLPAGAWRLTAWSLQRQERWSTDPVVAGAGEAVVLRRNSQQAEGRILLLDAATGEEVRGTVVLEFPDRVNRSRTIHPGARGIVPFPDLPGDGARVRATVEGYEPGEIDLDAPRPGDPPRQLRLIPSREGLGTARLVVVRSGTPVPELGVGRVHLFEGSVVIHREQVRTPEGRLVLDLPAGRQEVLLSAGEAAACVVLDVRAGGETEREIDLDAFGSVRARSPVSGLAVSFELPDGFVLHPPHEELDREGPGEAVARLYRGLPSGEIRAVARIARHAVPRTVEVPAGGTTEYRFGYDDLYRSRR